MSKLALIALAAVTLVLAGAGFTWNLASFAQNMLVELVGTLLSVLIAILVVERLLQHEHQRQWRPTWSSLAKTINFVADDFVYETYGYFQGLPFEAVNLYPDGIDVNPFGRPTMWADFVESQIHDLSSATRERPTYQVDHKLGQPHRWSRRGGAYIILVRDKATMERLEAEQERIISEMTSTESLYAALEPLLRRIEAYVIPRTLQFGDEHVLIEKLMSVETLWREWRRTMSLVAHDWGLAEQHAWAAFVQVARALDELAEYASENFA